MEEFKKELDTLLTKYPNLPEFTISIRPRIMITTPSLVPDRFGSTEIKLPAKVIDGVIPGEIEEMSRMISY